MTNNESFTPATSADGSAISPSVSTAPAMFDVKEYEALYTGMARTKLVKPLTNYGSFRPQGMSDEHWRLVEKEAMKTENVERARAFSSIGDTLRLMKKFGYGYDEEGNWNAKNLPSEMKQRIASSVLINFPHTFSDKETLKKSWGADNIDEVGERIATMLGQNIMTESERERYWQGLSESERIEAAMSLQEQIGVKNPHRVVNGDDAKSVFNYYSRLREKSYEAAFSELADNEEAKAAFALTFMSDDERKRNLEAIAIKHGGATANRIAEASYSFKAYETGNVFGIFFKDVISGTWNTTKELVSEGIDWLAVRNQTKNEEDVFATFNKELGSNGALKPEEFERLSDEQVIEIAKKTGLYEKAQEIYNTNDAGFLKFLYAEGYEAKMGEIGASMADTLGERKIREGDWGKKLASMAGTSVGYMIPVIGAGLIPGIGPAAGFGVAFAQGYDEYVDEIYASGDVTMTSDEIALGGSIYGAFYGATNVLSGAVAKGGISVVSKLTGRAGAKSAIDFNKRGIFAFVKDSMNQPSKLFLAKYGNGIAKNVSLLVGRTAIRESAAALGEGVQEAGEDFMRWAIASSVADVAKDYEGKEYLQEQDIVESMLESFRYGALLGVVQRGAFGLPNAWGRARGLFGKSPLLDGKSTLTANRDKLLSYIAVSTAAEMRGTGFGKGKGQIQLHQLAQDFVGGNEETRGKLRESAEYGKLTSEQKQRLETLAHVRDQLQETEKADIQDWTSGRDLKGKEGVRFNEQEAKAAQNLIRGRGILLNLLMEKSFYEQELSVVKDENERQIIQANLERIAKREEVVRRSIERNMGILGGRKASGIIKGEGVSGETIQKYYDTAVEFGNEEAQELSRFMAEVYGYELKEPQAQEDEDSGAKPQGSGGEGSQGESATPSPEPKPAAQTPTPAPKPTQEESATPSPEPKPQGEESTPKPQENATPKPSQGKPVEISTPKPAYSDNEPQTRTETTSGTSNEEIPADELPIERLAEVYEEKFENVLSTDNAKLLFKGYNPHDTKSISAFHAKAGAIVSKLFDYFIKTKKNAGDGSVVYTAGGVGSGKSTVVNSFKKNADFVMDSTMAGNIAYTRDGINKVLNNGQKAVLVYVYRDAKDAWYNGVLKRAKTSTGHVVSRETFTGTHTKAYENFKKLVDEFGDKVEVKVFEIVEGVAPIQISLEDLENKRFYTKEELGDIYDGKIPDEARPERDGTADRTSDGGGTGASSSSALRDEGGHRGMESPNAAGGASSNAVGGRTENTNDERSGADISGRRASESEPESRADKTSESDDSDNRELESDSPAREDIIPVADESGHDSIEPPKESPKSKPSLSAEETRERKGKTGKQAKLMKLFAELLAHIEAKTGVKIVRETDEQIRKSAEQAKGGKFSAMRRRKLRDDEWFIPRGKDYARLASQVGTLWRDRRSVDVYYLDETIFVCKKRRTHGDFEVLDAFHVEVSNEEFERRRQEAIRRLVDAEARGVAVGVELIRDAFGRDNGGASRTENGFATASNGRGVADPLRQDGEVSDPQSDNDNDVVYTKSGTLVAYRVGGVIGKQRYEADAKRVGLRFKADSHGDTEARSVDLKSLPNGYYHGGSGGAKGYIVEFVYGQPNDNYFDGTNEDADTYGRGLYTLKEDTLREITPEMVSFAAEYFGVSDEEARELLEPSDIIDSAGAWDDAQFVSELWQALEDDFLANGGAFKVGNGAVAFPYAKEIVEVVPPETGKYPEYDLSDSDLRYLSRGGVVYGYFDPVRKELHLNEDFADFDTPIHEWTHVWWSWVSEQDSRLTDKIVDLVKRLKAFKSLKAEAENPKSVYHGLDDAALAQEVFSRLVGERGEELITKSEKSVWAKLKEYMQDFFKLISQTFGLSDERIDLLSLGELRDMALRDLFSDEKFSSELAQTEKPSLSAEETRERMAQLREKVAEKIGPHVYYPEAVSSADIYNWGRELGLTLSDEQCKAVMFGALFGRDARAINALRKNGASGEDFFKAIVDSVYAISVVRTESDYDIVGALVEAASYWNKLKTSRILHDDALSADGIELQNILLNFADGTPETLKTYIGALGALEMFRNEYNEKDASWWDGTIADDVPFVASAIGFYTKFPSEVNVADSVLAMIRDIAKGDKESLIALQSLLAERHRAYDKTGTFDFDGSGTSAVVDKMSTVDSSGATATADDAATESNQPAAASVPVSATQSAIAGAAEDLKRTEGAEVKQRELSEKEAKVRISEKFFKRAVLPFVFKSKDPNERPVLQGVRYEGGFITATNAKVLVRVRVPYEAEYEGKIIIAKTGEEYSPPPNFPGAGYPKTSHLFQLPDDAEFHRIAPELAANAVNELKRIEKPADKTIKQFAKISVGGREVFISTENFVALSDFARETGSFDITIKGKENPSFHIVNRETGDHALTNVLTALGGSKSEVALEVNADTGEVKIPDGVKLKGEKADKEREAFYKNVIYPHMGRAKNDDYAHTKDRVYYKGGFVYATNARSVVKVAFAYPESLEGKVVEFKTNKEIVDEFSNKPQFPISILENLEIDGNLPKAVLDVDAVAKAVESVKSTDYDSAVSLKVGDKELFFRAKMLKDVLRSVQHVGGEFDVVFDEKNHTHFIGGDMHIVFAPIKPTKADTVIASFEFEAKKNALFDEKGDVKGAVSPENRIENFGEEVVGNRDMFGAYRKTLGNITKEQLKAKSLSEVFPRPNARALAKSGNVSADVAALTLYVYNQIPSKQKYAENYWLDSVLKASKTIQMLLENKALGDEYVARLRETAQKTERFRGFETKTGEAERAENTVLYIDTLKALGFPEEDVKLGKKSITVSHYTNHNEGKQYSSYVIRNGKTRVKCFDSFEDAVEALRGMVESGKGKNRGEAKIELILLRYRSTGERFIAVGKPSRYHKLKGGFNDWDSARAYLEENRAALEELYRRIKDVPSERNAENAERIGADWRKGKDVSPEQFATTFGFKGIRFGKWVEQDNRQERLNDTFDGLMDLADLLGVSPKALSLNGELDFAFGALGYSSASAHYEANNKVINLTKKRGAGSLAHEWWHALDNYFGAMSGSGMSMITEAEKFSEDKIRKEVAEVFFAVRDAIKNSNLAARSGALDRLSSGKPYWGKIVEMTARSFEAWVKNEIERDGRSNDFLANITSHEAWMRDRPETDGAKFDDYPYPLPSELESFGTLFRALADTIEERTGENGSVALYQMSTTEAMTISESDQRLLAAHVGGFVPGATVRIVDDVESAAGEAARAQKVFSGSTYDADAEVEIVKIENPLSRAEQKNTAKIKKEILLPLVGLSVEIDSDKRIVGFTKTGVESALKKRNLHRSILSSLERVIKKSYYFDYIDSDGQEKHKDVLGQFIYAVPVNINGVVYRCEIKIDRLKSNTTGEGTFKQQSVFEIADVALSTGLNTRARQGRLEAEATSTTSATMKMDELMGGRKPNVPRVRYQRALHGSPHRFAEEAGAPFGRFRDDKMGTGEGNQAFGWGHYLTNRTGIARGYAETLAKKLAEKTAPRVLVKRPNPARVKEAEENLYRLKKELQKLVSPKERIESLENEERRLLDLLGETYKEVERAKKALSELESSLLRRVFNRSSIAKQKRVLEDALNRIDDYKIRQDKTSKLIAENYSDEAQRAYKQEYSRLSSEIRVATMVLRQELKGRKEYVYEKIDRHLYTAEFDDAGLLDWRKPLTAEQQLRIAEQLREEGLEEEADALADDAKHGTLYTAKELHENDGVLGLNSPQERSKLLHRAGFVGHKFPAQSMGAGDYSKGTNYVIYDESALNIVDRVSWMRDLDGVFGAYVPGSNQVFVAKNARVDTLLHELGWHATFHWAALNAPELRSVMEGYAADAPAELKAKVAEVYGYEDGKISDEEFLDECGAALFSEQNRDLMESVLEQVQGRGVKIKVRNWWKKFVDAVKKVWAKLTRDYSERYNEQGREYVDIARILSRNSDNPSGAMRELAQAFADGKALRSGTVPSGNASPLRERVEHKRALYQRAGRAIRKETMPNTPKRGAWNEWRDRHLEIMSFSVIMNSTQIYDANAEQARLALKRAKESAAQKKILSGTKRTEAERKQNMDEWNIPLLGSSAGGVEGWSAKVWKKLKNRFKNTEGVGDDYILEVWKDIVVPSFDLASISSLSAENIQALTKKTEAIRVATSVDEAMALAKEAESMLKNRSEEKVVNEHRAELIKLINRYKGRWGNKQAQLNSQRKTQGVAEYYLHALATLNGYLTRGDYDSWDRDVKSAQRSLENAASDEAELQANAFLQAEADLAGVPINDMSDEQVLSLLDKCKKEFTEGVVALESAKKERLDATKNQFGAIVDALFDAYKKTNGKVEGKRFRNFLRIGYSVRDKFDVLISSADTKFRDAAYLAAEELGRRMMECEMKKGAMVSSDATAFLGAVAEIYGEKAAGKNLTSKNGAKRSLSEAEIERKYLVPTLLNRRDGSEKFSRWGSKLTDGQLLCQYLMIRQREHDHLFSRAKPEQIAKFDEETMALYNRWKRQGELKEFLGAKLVALGDRIVEIMDSHAESIDKQSVRDTGLPLSYKRNGYFPIVRNLEEYMTDVVVVGKSPVIPKVLIPRSHSSYDIDEEADVLSVFRRHSNDIAHYLSHGELNQELRLMLNGDDFKAFRKHIAVVGGEGLSEDLSKHIQDVISGRMAGAEYYNPSEKVVSKAIRVCRWIARCCALGFNIVSGLKQVAGGLASFALDHGFVKMLSVAFGDHGSLFENWKEIYQSDGYKTRYPGMAMERAMSAMRIGDSKLGRFIPAKAIAMALQFEQSMMFATANGDKIPLFLVGSSLYGALKEHYYGQGNISREEAKAKALSVFWERVDRCQQAKTVANMDAFSRGHNEILKSTVQFLTAPLQFATAEIKAIEMLAKERTTEAWKHLANVAIHNHVLEPGMMLLVALLTSIGDDDDEFDWSQNILPFVFGSMDSLPLIGGSLEMMFEGRYKNSAWSPAALEYTTRLGDRARKVVASLFDGEDDTTWAAVKKLARTASVVRQVQDILPDSDEE